MEYCSSESSINCCFCDKNLSPGDKETETKSIIKYKCPGCERLYCSANCCSGHKEKFSCSGIRDQTPYVSLSKFDQKQFLDDYFFLEKINGGIERAQRILPRIPKPKRKQLGTKNRFPKKRYCNTNKRKEKSQDLKAIGGVDASNPQQ